MGGFVEDMSLVCKESAALNKGEEYEKKVIVNFVHILSSL